MNRLPAKLIFLCTFALLLAACASSSTALPSPLTSPPTLRVAAEVTASASATLAPPATSTSSPSPTAATTVESLEAQVSADRLSCRYGPGPDYLYLYGLRKGANLKLIGRTDGSGWVWVEGKNRCWLNADFISIQGDMSQLPITYPDPARLPVSPYYPPTTIRSAVRSGDTVTVEWRDIPLRAGDEEDETMLHYIVELWRCQDGQVIFDPLATNDLSVSFIDQPGCTGPSHGRVFVQEKHGFAGPAEIPWPR